MIKWIIVGIVAVLLIICLVIGYLMYKYATHPLEQPRLDWTKVKRFSGFEAKVEQAFKDYDALKKEEVSIESFDHLTLKAEVIRADNPKGTIIMAHGHRSSAIVDFTIMIKYLHDEGYNLLLIAQRGCAISGGNCITFGINERKDLFKWINFACDYFQSDVMYLYGVSLGAATVIMETGYELPSSIKGIIADSGFTSPWAICADVLKKNQHLPPIPFLIFSTFYGLILGHFNFLSYNCKKALKHNQLPILYIHGTKDPFVPYWMSVRNFQNTHSSKELLAVEGALHATSMLHDTTTYCQKLSSFLAQNK